MLNAKFKLCWLLCIFHFSFFIARAAPISIPLFGTNLNPSGGFGPLYLGEFGAPEGGYLFEYGTQPGFTLTLPIPLGQTLPAGNYAAFVKAIDFNWFGTATFFVGDGSGSEVMSDLDATVFWGVPIIVTTTVATNELQLKFTGANAGAKVLLLAIYITDNTNEIMFRNDYAIPFHYPTTNQYDLSAATSSNLVKNGSFEAGIGSEWRIVAAGHSENVNLLSSTEQAHSGSASLKLPGGTSGFFYTLQSNPILCASNKSHTFSVWARTASGVNPGLAGFISTYNTPAGFSNVQNLITGSGSLGTTWTKFSFTSEILEYPMAEVYIKLYLQLNNGTAVYFDDLMLIEGTNSIFQPHCPFELGISANETTRVFLNAANTNQLNLLGYNWTSGSVTQSVNYEVHDWTNALAASGTLSITAAAGALGTTQFTVPTNRLGHFRARFWVTDMDNEIETTWVMTRPPVTRGTNSNWGAHTDSQTNHLAALRRLGVEFNRVLSPLALFRWAFTETTPGNFTYFDSYVAAMTNQGFLLMGNLSQVSSPAAYWEGLYSFARTANVVGTFQVGELFKNASCTGTVTTVLFSTNGTGTGLQWTNYAGTWSGSITGVTSGATADKSGEVYTGVIPFDRWSIYVSNTVAHYASSVKYWEIWNEPNLATGFFPSATDYGFYAELARLACLIIKGIGSDLNIILGGGVANYSYLTGTYDALPAGFTNFFDAWSIHAYPGNEVGIESAITNLLAYGRPLWNTETGPLDKGSFTGVNSPFRRAGHYLTSYASGRIYYETLNSSPRELARNLLTCVGAGLTKYFLYDAREPTYDVTDWDSPQWTLFDYDESVRAKGAVYSGIINTLGNAAGQGPMVLKNAQSSAYLFLRGTNPIVSLWGLGATNRTITLASNVTTNNFKVYDLMGNAVLPSSLALDYGPMPILIEGQGSLSLSNLNYAVTNGTLVARADTVAPQLVITKAPRVPNVVRPYYRWLAIDDVDVPKPASLDATVYRYKLDSDSYSDWSGQTFVSYPALEDGYHVFTVQAQDLSGNISTATSSMGDAPVGEPTGLRVQGIGKMSIQGNVRIP